MWATGLDANKQQAGDRQTFWEIISRSLNHLRVSTGVSNCRSHRQKVDGFGCKILHFSLEHRTQYQTGRRFVKVSKLQTENADKGSRIRGICLQNFLLKMLKSSHKTEEIMRQNEAMPPRNVGGKTAEN